MATTKRTAAKRAKVSRLPVRESQRKNGKTEASKTGPFAAAEELVANGPERVAALEAEAAALRAEIGALGEAVRKLARESSDGAALSDGAREQARKLTERVVESRQRLAALRTASGELRGEARKRSDDIRREAARAQAELAVLHRRAAAQQSFDQKLRDEVAMLSRQLLTLLERPEPDPGPPDPPAPAPQADDAQGAGMAGLA